MESPWNCLLRRSSSRGLQIKFQSSCLKNSVRFRYAADSVIVKAVYPLYISSGREGREMVLTFAISITKLSKNQ